MTVFDIVQILLAIVLLVGSYYGQKFCRDSIESIQKGVKEVVEVISTVDGMGDERRELVEQAKRDSKQFKAYRRAYFIVGLFGLFWISSVLQKIIPA